MFNRASYLAFLINKKRFTEASATRYLTSLMFLQKNGYIDLAVRDHSYEDISKVIVKVNDTFYATKLVLTASLWSYHDFLEYQKPASFRRPSDMRAFTANAMRNTHKVERFEDFVAYLYAKNLRPSSIYSYAVQIIRLTRYINAPITLLDAMKPAEDVIEKIAAPVSVATTVRMLSTFRCYSRFAKGYVRA